MQLDKLYTPTLGLPETNAAGLAVADDARLWLWTAMDPVSKLLLVAVGGSRSLTVAQRVVHLVKQRLVSAGRPLFITDGLSHYRTALLTPILVNDSRRRLVAIKHRFVFGPRQQVQAILEKLL